MLHAEKVRYFMDKIDGTTGDVWVPDLDPSHDRKYYLAVMEEMFAWLDSDDSSDEDYKVLKEEGYFNMLAMLTSPRGYEDEGL